MLLPRGRFVTARTRAGVTGGGRGRYQSLRVRAGRRAKAKELATVGSSHRALRFLDREPELPRCESAPCTAGRRLNLTVPYTLLAMPRAVTVGLHAAIVAVTEEEPRVLTVPEASLGRWMAALPFGPLDPDRHRTIELGLRAWVHEQTGMDLAYVEQLYTFGDRDRALAADGRTLVLAIAYLALVRERQVAGGHTAAWQGIYGVLPWEDRRDGEPEILRHRIRPALADWADAAPADSARRERRGRVGITFGSGAAPWDGERVLDRYELLYEAGLVAESGRDREPAPHAVQKVSSHAGFGAPLALDHRRILATALGRLRGKLKYRPLAFELLPDAFTLFQLQRTVEALVGVRLHKQNFRRLVERGALVEGIGQLEPDTGGRPAELFRFRREVLHKRPAPGVGLPGLPAGHNHA